MATILQKNFKSQVKIVDLRSDASSLPTAGMRTAIRDAVIADDVYSVDPTVHELETRCAKLMRKEAACYLPTGTLGNLVCVLVHCNERGSEAIVGHSSHINLCEQEGIAQFGGVSVREVRNKEDGTFDLNELEALLRPRYSIHKPNTKLITVESTHNFLGGRVVPLEWLDELAEFAKEKKLKLHLDGARMFNAALKLNVPVSRIARDFDSLTVCFSKGLGAPFGAIVMGSSKFIKKVRKLKSSFGSTPRQSGFMAAPALYALDHMEHLKDDHLHTQVIAQAIREADNPYITVPKPEDVHTNILLIKVDTSKLTAERLVERLSTCSKKDRNLVVVKGLSIANDVVRFVLSSNNTRNDVEQAVVKIKAVVNEFK